MRALAIDPESGDTFAIGERPESLAFDNRVHVRGVKPVRNSRAEALR